MNGTVIVFARTPAHGEVKTRLAATLGHDAALRLHRAFLQDTLAAAQASGAHVVLARTPGPPFQEEAHAQDVIVQRGDTFGERFDNAFADVAALHAPPYLIVGVDTPQLGPQRIAQAIHRLRQADFLIGPAPRGGFHMLGFRARPVPVAAVFPADDQVAELEALLAPHGTVEQTRAETDMDHAEDLEVLRGWHDTEWTPRHTLAAMAELGLA